MAKSMSAGAPSSGLRFKQHFRRNEGVVMHTSEHPEALTILHRRRRVARRTTADQRDDLAAARGIVRGFVWSLPVWLAVVGIWAWFS